MKRHGFTITEMLVSMALIMFIMVILSEAFIAGLESFRQLKAIGDMETNLRTAATLLRRDLQATHFTGGTGAAGPLRLNNLLPTTSFSGGFFSVMVSYPAPKIYDYDGSIVNNGAQGQKQVFVTNPPPVGTFNGSVPARLVTTGSPAQDEETFTDPTYTGGNPIKLGAEIKNDGHTQVWLYSPPAAEGSDADGLPSYGGPADNGYALYFTVDLAGKAYTTDDVKLFRRESYFTASLSSGGARFGSQSANRPLLQSTIAQGSFAAGTPPGSADFTRGQPPFYDPANYYTPFAEVAYFLQESGQSTSVPPPPPLGAGGGATKLYNLYRRQLALLNASDSTGTNNPMNGVPASVAIFPPVSVSPIANIPVAAVNSGNASYYDFSWMPVFDPGTKAYYMHFNSMEDLRTNPGNRSLTYAFPAYGHPPLGAPLTAWNAYTEPKNMPRVGDRGEPSPSLVGADLLLTNVINMTIRIKRKTADNMDFDFVYGGYDTHFNGTTSFQIIAIEIILRIWDQKTQRTRQLTIIQNM